MLPLDFVTAAHAQGGATGGPQSAFSALVPVLLMFAVFYFLLIRPQQKKAKEHQAMLDAIARGDEVVTQGGIHGTVVGLTDQIVTIEIASLDEGKGKGAAVRVKVDRSAIARKKAAAAAEGA